MDPFDEDFNGLLDVLALVGVADETGFVGRGGQVDAIFEGVVEKLFEFFGMTGGSVVKIAYGLVGKEEGKHGADLGDLEGNAFLAGGVAEGLGDL